MVAAASVVVCGLLICLLLLRRRHSRRLRRYDVILSQAWSRAPHSMVMLDENRQVCFANRPLLGFGATPVVGAPLGDTIPREPFQLLTLAIDKAFDTGRFQNLELTLHQDDAPDRHYDVLVLPAIDAGEALGVALQSIDVTDLRAMERQFLDGTSLQRLQLGGELHEGLAQELAGVLLMLSGLSNTLQRESAGGAHLVTLAAEQLAQSISSARRMAQDLAPVRIERGSLADALQRLVESGTQRLGIAVSCECLLDGCAISDVAADHIHQFCRAALFDAALVDGCHRIRFQLRVMNDSLMIRITGDRKRKPANGSPRDESPAKMMVFRARMLGGSLNLGPDLDGQFAVTLTIPAGQLQNRMARVAASRPSGAMESMR
jgi:signal transduction histidine kinase